MLFVSLLQGLGFLPTKSEGSKNIETPSASAQSSTTSKRKPAKKSIKPVDEAKPAMAQTRKAIKSAEPDLMKKTAKTTKAIAKDNIHQAVKPEKIDKADPIKPPKPGKADKVKATVESAVSVAEKATTGAKAPLKTKAAKAPKVPKVVLSPKASKPLDVVAQKPVTVVPEVPEVPFVSATPLVAPLVASVPVVAKAAAAPPSNMPTKTPRRSLRRPSTPSAPAPQPVPTHAPNAAKATFTPSFSQRDMTPHPVQVPAKKNPKLAQNWKTKPAHDLTDEEVLSMPDSEYMNAAQLAFFKHKLQTLKNGILANAGETADHLREESTVTPDPADRATIEEEHALELRTRDRERKLLKKIDQSIARIDAGDYGYCDETGEPIGAGRLIARPTANLSIEAQQRRELKQKMFGD